MNMKSLLLALTASAALVLSVSAPAATDLAKSKGCLNCHDLDKKKAGPSIKDIAAKAKPAGEVVPKVKEAKGHPKVNASEDEIKSIYDEMLSNK
jgi:cytochrome c